MNDDWFDMITALLDARARFLIVGAHAMAVHGVPRATQDLDCWIEPEPGNAKRVWDALSTFGAPLASLGVSREDLAAPETVLQLGLPPNRIDLMTGISGVPSFEAAWSQREDYPVRDRTVPFLGRGDLILNKRASGRKKDLADLDALGEP
jgi:hypothetical protein